jgi:hypothetical protein
MARYPFGNRRGNKSRSRGRRGFGGGAGATVSAVTGARGTVATGPVSTGAGMLTGGGGSMGVLAGTNAGGPSATVGLGGGAAVVIGGDGIGWTSGCFAEFETQMTDTTRAMRRAANKPPPTIAGAGKRGCATAGSIFSAASTPAAARTSVPVAARDPGDVTPSPSKSTPTGSRTFAMLLEHPVRCLLERR